MVENLAAGMIPVVGARAADAEADLLQRGIDGPGRWCSSRQGTHHGQRSHAPTRTPRRTGGWPGKQLFGRMLDLGRLD